MEPTPNDHDESPSKRRRLHIPPTPGSATIERYVGTSTSSPLLNNPDETTADDDHSQESRPEDDLPLTQDPSLLRSVSTTNASSTPSAAVADHPSTERSTEFTPIVPLSDIPQTNVDIIKEAIADVYGFNDPRPFQIEAVNHLAFQDDSSLRLHGWASN